MNRRSKIVYVTAQTPFGTGEVWALREMLALKAAGAALLVIPRTASGQFFHEDAASLTDETVSVPFLNLSSVSNLFAFALRNPISFAKIILWISRQAPSPRDWAIGLAVLPKALYLAHRLKEEPVIHIHAHSTTSVAVVAYVLATVLGVPWSFTMHTSVLTQPKFRRLLDAQLKSAQFGRAVSQQTADAIIDMMGERFRSKIRVIHLGVDSRVAISDTESGWSSFTAATPAALIEHKGHKYAIEACTLLRERNLGGFKWHFYGEGPLAHTIENRIREFGLSETVSLDGVISNSDLRSRYARGEIHAVVLPSVATDTQWEGIPHALMQAMAYAIPVIGTNSGGTLELIGEGAGICVPQRDAQSLANALEKLMKDPEFWHRQGAAGRLRISQDFDQYQISRQLMEAFQAQG